MGEQVPEVRITDTIAIPASELRVSFVRSGGPGGQNVNKVASKVQLRWTPATSAAFSEADRAWLLNKLASKLTTDGDLIVASNLTRDQGRNRVDAEAKLAALIIAALVRPKKRRATKPSRAARERRVDEKKARGLIKKGRRGTDD
jgi:ribosome-associated protein